MQIGRFFLTCEFITLLLVKSLYKFVNDALIEVMLLYTQCQGSPQKAQHCKLQLFLVTVASVAKYLVTKLICSKSHQFDNLCLLVHGISVSWFEMHTGKLLADNQVINPLLYKISMHILHTVLFTFP